METLENFLEPITFAIGVFIANYNETHYIPADLSGKLFCIKYPESKITSLIKDTERHQALGFKILDQDKDVFPAIFYYKGCHFKIVPIFDIEDPMVYEPSYNDYRSVEFFQMGRMVNNSVIIKYSFG